MLQATTSGSESEQQRNKYNYYTYTLYIYSLSLDLLDHQRRCKSSFFVFVCNIKQWRLLLLLVLLYLLDLATWICRGLADCQTYKTTGISPRVPGRRLHLDQENYNTIVAHDWVETRCCCRHQSRPFCNSPHQFTYFFYSTNYNTNSFKIFRINQIYSKLF